MKLINEPVWNYKSETSKAWGQVQKMGGELTGTGRGRGAGGLDLPFGKREKTLHVCAQMQRVAPPFRNSESASEGNQQSSEAQ